MNIDILTSEECSRLSTLIDTSHQRMKNLYRLPDGKNVTESKKEKELIAALQNGDVEAVERLKRGG